MSVDPVLIVQVALVAALFVCYGVYTGWRRPKARRLSAAYMLPLVSFILKQKVEKGEVEEAVRASKEEALVFPSDDFLTGLYNFFESPKPSFRTLFERYQKDGSLPSAEEFKPGKWYQGKPRLYALLALLGPLLAPVVAPLVWLWGTVSHFYRRMNTMRLGSVFGSLLAYEDDDDDDPDPFITDRNSLFHTEDRRSRIAKAGVVLVPSVIYLLMDVQLLFSWSRKLGVTVFVLLCLSTVGCLFYVLYVFYQQYSWKRYWKTKLLEALAKAEHGGSDGDFHKALTFLEYIEGEPDYPIPGTLAAYTGVWAFGHKAVDFIAAFFRDQMPYV
jgi:hypothetical protein